MNTADVIQEILDTWPHSNTTPHTGVRWYALRSKVEALCEVYEPDQVMRAIVHHCERSQSRFTADGLASLMVELYPSSTPFTGDVGKDVYCNDEDAAMLAPAIKALDDDSSEHLMRLSRANNVRGVAEWLCRETPALTLIAMVRRGAP